MALPTVASSPLHTEASAVHHAMLWALHNNWDLVECWTDSAQIVDLVTQYPDVLSPIIPLLADISYLASCCRFCLIKKVNRVLVDPSC